jgi:hypothetical protein
LILEFLGDLFLESSMFVTLERKVENMEVSYILILAMENG